MKLTIKSKLLNALNRRQIAIFILLFVYSHSTWANDNYDCANDFSLLFANQYYYLHMAGRPTVLQYKYLHTVKKDGKIFHVFEFEGGQFRAEIEEGKIFGLREIDTLTPDEVLSKKDKDAIKLLKAILAQVHEHARHALIPQRVLAEDSGIKVVSNTFKDVQKAEQVLKNIKDTDRYLSDAGFFIPGDSRVVITNKPLLNRNQGPSAWEVLVRDPQSGDYQRVIDLRAINEAPGLIFDRTVHAHERTHSIIQHNFSNQMPTRQQTFFQEALCDFVGIEVGGVEEVGKAAAVKGTKPIRNIRDRSSYEENRRFPLRSYADFFEEPHHNSMTISNFLLQLRDAVGSKEVQKLLMPLFTDLSKYRPNYLANPEIYIPGFQYANTARQMMIHDFEYFLAVFVHSTIGHPKQREMLQVVKNVLEQYGINNEEFLGRALMMTPSPIAQVTPLRSVEMQAAKNMEENTKKVLVTEISFGVVSASGAGLATYYLMKEEKSK